MAELAGVNRGADRAKNRTGQYKVLAGFFVAAVVTAGCGGGGSHSPLPQGPTTETGGRHHTHHAPGESYVATVLDDSPIAFYRLMESSGSVAYDSSGHSYNGAYLNSVNLKQPALLRSDGATSASFPSGYMGEQATWTNQAVSAECWTRPTAADLAGAPRILDNAWTDHDGNGFMMWISAGTAAFNTGWLSTVGTYALKPGQIYYIAGTYDNATGATLYINGLEVTNAMPGALPNPQTGDSSTTYVGVLNANRDGGPGLTDYFQGDIGDCAVYDHALTPQQVADHYNAGADQHVSPSPPPSPQPTMSAPPPTTAPSPIAYNSSTACIGGKIYTNTVLPRGEGEFSTNGLDRAWWGRQRGNPIGGNQYSGFQTSWGRNQYDTYFGDSSDGLPGGHDPFYVGPDTGAPGAPQGVRIEAVPMPSDLVGNPQVGGADFYSGVLDTPINLTHGFFVARLRMPPADPGMSPAFWMLTNNGTPQGQHGPLNGEWDIQEMFGNDLGTGMNAGTILWNSGSNTPQNWGGTYAWPNSEQSSPSAGYHDYGALIRVGGAKISDNDYGPGGPGYEYGQTGIGVTNYLDGVPLYGHTGGADVTWRIGWKELMAMFQVGPPGGWLGTPNQADFPADYWIQWIRVYQRTSKGC